MLTSFYIHDDIPPTPKTKGISLKVLISIVLISNIIIAAVVFLIVVYIPPTYRGVNPSTTTNKSQETLSYNRDIQNEENNNTPSLTPNPSITPRYKSIFISPNSSLSGYVMSASSSAFNKKDL